MDKANFYGKLWSNFTPLKKIPLPFTQSQLSIFREFLCKITLLLDQVLSVILDIFPGHFHSFFLRVILQIRQLLKPGQYFKVKYCGTEFEIIAQILKQSMQLLFKVTENVQNICYYNYFTDITTASDIYLVTGGGIAQR